VNDPEKEKMAIGGLFLGSSRSFGAWRTVVAAFGPLLLKPKKGSDEYVDKSPFRKLSIILNILFEHFYD
jgi:hypothetical protein